MLGRSASTGEAGLSSVFLLGTKHVLQGAVMVLSGRDVSLCWQIALYPWEAVSSLIVFLFSILWASLFYFKTHFICLFLKTKFCNCLCLLHTTNFYMFNFSVFLLYFSSYNSYISLSYFLVTFSYPFSCHHVTLLKYVCSGSPFLLNDATEGTA